MIFKATGQMAWHDHDVRIGTGRAVSSSIRINTLFRAQLDKADLNPSISINHPPKNIDQKSLTLLATSSAS
jgi:hypothetical protein